MKFNYWTNKVWKLQKFAHTLLLAKVSWKQRITKWTCLKLKTWFDGKNVSEMRVNFSFFHSMINKRSQQKKRYLQINEVHLLMKDYTWHYWHQLTLTDWQSEWTNSQKHQNCWHLQHLLTFTDSCWHLLIVADIYWQLLTFTDSC